MTSSVRLRIDHLAVEIAEDQQVAELEDTLRAALSLLATRLAGAPFAADDVARHAVSRLAVTPLAPGWFSQPGAAARLAEDLYARLLDGLR